MQVDRHLPAQFELEYVGEDGKRHRPVMIHRGYLSTMERMISFLIEHYAGAFPVWLAPVQAIILPLKTDDEPLLEYARDLQNQLVKAKFRAKLDERNESVNRRVRDAELMKVPVIIVVGPRDRENGVADVRFGVRGKEIADGLKAKSDAGTLTESITGYANAEVLLPFLEKAAQSGDGGRVGALALSDVATLLKYLTDAAL